MRRHNRNMRRINKTLRVIMWMLIIIAFVTVLHEVLSILNTWFPWVFYPNMVPSAPSGRMAYFF